MTKNIYDEKVYLKGNKEALEEFEKRRRIVILLYATERFLYSNIIDEYKKYIDKIVGLLRSSE